MKRLGKQGHAVLRMLGESFARVCLATMMGGRGASSVNPRCWSFFKVIQ